MSEPLKKKYRKLKPTKSRGVWTSNWTPGWAASAAQHSGTSRPLSSNIGIDPLKSVTKDSVEKSFSAFPKITPLLQTGRRNTLNASAKFEYSQETRNP